MNNFLREPTEMSVFLCGNGRGGHKLACAGHNTVQAGHKLTYGGHNTPHAGHKNNSSWVFTIWYALFEY